MSNRNKDLVIYHGNCDDGFGSAFSHWFWTGRDLYATAKSAEHNFITTNSTIYYEGYYNKDFPWDLLKEEIGINRVFIVDFSYEPEKLAEICSKVSRVVVLDHHKKFIDSVQHWLEPNTGKPTNLELFVSNELSGAQLSWTFFSGLSTNTAPVMIDHIGDNDLWQFKINETKEFMQALRSYPRTFDEWFEIYMRTDRQLKGYEEFIKEGKSILKYSDNLIKDIIEKGINRITLDGIQGLSCNSPKLYSSDIGNILAKESNTFGMTWYLDNEELVICSLRSIGDYDVNELAKKFGGGGHKNAAGFTTSLHELQDLLDSNLLE